ncbi:hypothetical protein AFLA_001490 [Aspergillus flavus NRRL3357]|nr:hypothetical protein AFLA_001490 [Aspergillus flavus NRRL3357]
MTPKIEDLFEMDRAREGLRGGRRRNPVLVCGFLFSIDFFGGNLNRRILDAYFRSGLESYRNLGLHTMVLMVLRWVFLFFEATEGNLEVL